MTSVWVIEDGEYSDYHVVGVYSSKENAEAALSLIGDGCCPIISKWPLDPGIDDINAGLNLFLVNMKASGDTESVSQRNLAWWDHNANAIQYKHDKLLWPEGSEKQVPYRTGQGDLVVGTVFAKDEKHAVKIVNEKRIQLLAAGKIRQGPV